MKKYSIVCFLESESKQKVLNLQQTLFELTGSRACLDDWAPHITVGDGPEVSEIETEILEKEIQNLVDIYKPFPLLLNSFGGRTNRKGGKDEITTPYVLWINTIVSDTFDKLLIEIEKITYKYNHWYTKPNPYIPHVTIAFRDLSQEGYEKGAEYLNSIDFKETIQISHIALVEQTEKESIEYKRFYFNQ